MTKAFLGLMAVTLLISSHLFAQDNVWDITNIKSSIMMEISGNVADMTIKRTAQEGSIVEIRGMFSARSGGRVGLDIMAITLSGTTVEHGITINWEVSPIAIGLDLGTQCNYLFPDIIIEGAVRQSSIKGGEYELGREKEDSPLILTIIAHPTPLCLAFPAPVTSQGQMFLKFGTTNIVVPDNSNTTNLGRPSLNENSGH